MPHWPSGQMAMAQVGLVMRNDFVITVIPMAYFGCASQYRTIVNNIVTVIFAIV